MLLIVWASIQDKNSSLKNGKTHVCVEGAAQSFTQGQKKAATGYDVRAFISDIYVASTSESASIIQCALNLRKCKHAFCFVIYVLQPIKSLQ